MLNSSTANLYDTCNHFLEQSPQERLFMLKNLGLARYADFLTKMALTEANISCVMQFFKNPSRVKFPNLRGAELYGLVLDNVNFIRGDLTGANLKGSHLVNADLLFANFTRADLRDANLTGATLNETIWSATLVERCNFGTGVGLTSQQHQYLRKRGAKFEFPEQVGIVPPT